MVTHEQFIHAVREAALKVSTLTSEQNKRIAAAKLVYGFGERGLRGSTRYNAWQNGQTDDFIEVCAAAEENWIQLAGTTLHELAHTAAGMGTGHGKEWSASCLAVGLRRCLAAGNKYSLASFTPAMRDQLARMEKPADGVPTGGDGLNLGMLFRGLGKLRPCGAGIGTRGGKSRGKGSGSRLRKYVCAHGQIIRASTDELHAHCDDCGSAFKLDVPVAVSPVAPTIDPSPIAALVAAAA